MCKSMSSCEYKPLKVLLQAIDHSMFAKFVPENTVKKWKWKHFFATYIDIKP